MGVLGNHLRELREKKGISVREFAGHLQKTPGYISRIEARDEIPSPELLCEMAAVLDANPEQLLELAKECQIRHAEQQIEQRHKSALSLFRKRRME
jgi:transcriptional regulator with XRE-family HTH domain